MKKIAVLLAAAAIAAGGWYYFRKRAEAAKPKYLEAAAELRDISDVVETTGVVEPENRVEIQPPSAGRIEELLAEEGERINAGEVLALMSSADRVAILDAARAAGEEQYRHWKETYKPIKIISPIDGTLILRNIVAGQTVGASAVLFAISDRLIVSASLDEADIGRVKLGQRASIVLDAYPGRKVRGEVFKVLDEGVSKNNVVTYSVKLRPESVPDFFRSQMTANIKIRISERRGVLMVPARAVTNDGQGRTAVARSLKDGKPDLSPVETGQLDGDHLEIASGLRPGDKVFYPDKPYVPQKAQGGANPLMPSRPGMSRQQQRAVRGH